MYLRTVLDVSDALAALDAMSEAAPRETESPLAFAVVDDNGDMVAFGRMDGAQALARSYAVKKAYTASLMRMDLQTMAELRIVDGTSATGFTDPRFLASDGGGVTISGPSGGIAGGIGVSGGTPEEDERVARMGLAAIRL